MFLVLRYVLRVATGMLKRSHVCPSSPMTSREACLSVASVGTDPGSVWSDMPAAGWHPPDIRPDLNHERADERTGAQGSSPADARAPMFVNQVNEKSPTGLRAR